MTSVAKTMTEASSTIELPNKAYLLPKYIAMWPPVWWTWLLVAALLVVLLAICFFSYRRYQQRGYRRDALTSIKSMPDNLNNKQYILLCHEMVRRCLISERQQLLASLPSTVLFENLDRHLPKKHRFGSLGAVFIEGPYRPQIELTSEQRTRMIQVTCYWIRKHHA
ncbi:DUF4381 family protein [Marinomonas sp. IMCC 4694]|uniref:DUF4381 family protein n=1 Tax=Marinomonas sp. IMCC 4694 TaxID=2605432 RepID=UPI0011E6BDE6|nr:DUF4381 family protein [Marinomonas sp. IMCC 4694]TYL47516.1 DUF4381 domain-containing protein [Marinomonas sp. IMCC 4694]